MIAIKNRSMEPRLPLNPKRRGSSLLALIFIVGLLLLGFAFFGMFARRSVQPPAAATPALDAERARLILEQERVRRDERSRLEEALRRFEERRRQLEQGANKK